MNHAAILAELETAPADVEECWRWLLRLPLKAKCRRYLMDPRWPHHPPPWSELPDAISDLAEFCARMVEIEGCEHRNMVDPNLRDRGFALVGEIASRWLPSDGTICTDCPAEYHGGRWV